MSDNLQQSIIQTLENHHRRSEQLERAPVAVHWLRRVTARLIRVVIFGVPAVSLAPHAEHWTLRGVTIILAIGAVLNTAAALEILEGRRG